MSEFFAVCQIFRSRITYDLDVVSFFRRIVASTTSTCRVPGSGFLLFLIVFSC